MPWPFIPGETLTSTNLNDATISKNALCQLVQTGTQSINHNDVTPVAFTGEDLDPLGWHSTSSLTERVVPTIAGWYRVTFSASWSTDTDYTRLAIQVHINGVALGAPSIGFDLIQEAAVAGGRIFGGSSPLISCNGTSDYLSIAAYQTNTGGQANTVQCRLLVELVHPT